MRWIKRGWRCKFSTTLFTWSALTEIECNVCLNNVCCCGAGWGAGREAERGERLIWATGWSMSGLQLRNSTNTRVSIVQFTSSSSSCSGVLHVWVEVTFPSVENLKAGLPFILRKKENFLHNRCRLLMGGGGGGHQMGSSHRKCSVETVMITEQTLVTGVN